MCALAHEARSDNARGLLKQSLNGYPGGLDPPDDHLAGCRREWEGIPAPVRTRGVPSRDGAPYTISLVHR